MEESEQTSLKGLFQGMCGGDVQVLQGIVKSASPLKIQIVNDEKLVIGPNITYVPRHLTNYTTTCSLSKGTKGSVNGDRKSTRLNSSHPTTSRMPSSA